MNYHLNYDAEQAITKQYEQSAHAWLMTRQDEQVSEPAAAHAGHAMQAHS